MRAGARDDVERRPVRADGGDFLLDARYSRFGARLHQAGSEVGARFLAGIAVELVHVEHQPSEEVGFERSDPESGARRFARAAEAAHAFADDDEIKSHVKPV
jgi:hypothetical protein